MNDNHIAGLFFEGGQVCRLAVPFWMTPGFAIPLIQSQAISNVAYVQKVDRGQKVIGFEIFDDNVRTVDLDVLQSVRVGDEELVAFIDPVGKAHVGTQKSLFPIARKWVSQIQHPLIKMNFALFCGFEKIAMVAARNAVIEKEKELKDHMRASLWFVNSVALVELVKTVADQSRYSRADEQIFSEDISIGISRGKLTVELPVSLGSAGARAPSRFSRVARLIEIATGYKLNLIVKDPQRKKNNKEILDAIGPTISKIQKLRRQECRLAFVLKLLLTEPALGKTVLSQYSDKASFANRGLNIVRNAVSMTPRVTELEIANILSKIVSTAYPLQKGRLLFDFSEYLSEFKHIAMAIDEITNRSNSVYVEEYRDFIQKNLNKYI